MCIKLSTTILYTTKKENQTKSWGLIPHSESIPLTHLIVTVSIITKTPSDITCQRIKSLSLLLFSVKWLWNHCCEWVTTILLLFSYISQWVIELLASSIHSLTQVDVSVSLKVSLWTSLFQPSRFSNQGGSLQQSSQESVTSFANCR